MSKDSITLIGFMATGKTTVGKALVDYLGKNYRFIETDQIVIEMAGKPIPKIFSEDGEKKFREYEVEACKKVSKLKNVIISCGGGVVLNKTNINNLKKNCHIVLLKASLEEIYKRTMGEGKELRPVIDKEDPLNEIEKVWKYREKFYNKSVEYIVDTTDKSINEIVREILEKLNFQ
ncbi:MAG: shikimate kinase [Candidatus Thorarchaeota archaeon]